MAPVFNLSFENFLFPTPNFKTKILLDIVYCERKENIQMVKIRSMETTLPQMYPRSSNRLEMIRVLIPYRGSTSTKNNQTIGLGNFSRKKCQGRRKGVPARSIPRDNICIVDEYTLEDVGYINF